MVEDPRLTRTKIISKCNSNIKANSFEVPKSADLFWDIDFQKNQLLKRLNNAQFQKLQADRLEKLKTTDFKVLF